MKKNKITALILSAAMLLPNVVFAESNKEFDRFEQIINYAANLYIDEEATPGKIMTDALKDVLKDDPELTNKLIKAGFQSLDEYSEFYTEEEYELFKKNINHIVYGIGVIIQKVDDYVTIMSVTEGGGAEKAGVEIGDKIAKVDGTDVKGESVDKVQDLVVGENGTEVRITFLRDGQEFDRVIQRGEVKGVTVSSAVLEGNIGYIRIVNFGQDTGKEVADALDELDEKNVENIILDLRDNPGGYLDSAVEAASLFVPEGLIVSTVYRNEWENEYFYSKLEKAKYKLAVLVNENTASAAEVLSSAIQDSGAGILIGDITYGKGVIQQMFDIWNGCAFKITTGRYFTRNGKDINGDGIIPDEFVDNTKKQIDITKYQTFDYKTKPSVGDVSQNVRAAKERLRIMGYFQGTIDDNFDVSLEKAIYSFQANNELFPYGVLDISTQVKMENTFYKLEETVDNQMIFAYEYFGGDKDKLYSNNK